jgi:hypothetical protein
MTEPQDKPLNELLSRSMVDIYVGHENTHWILHEKLLCARSNFFSAIFYKKSPHGTNGNKSMGLPEEEDDAFRLFVGWLYSSYIPLPEQESNLGNLFDVYLMGEKWAIAGLVKDVLEAVRKYYRITNSFPGLRRVQYIYANTDSESPMRKFLIGSIARMLALSSSMPAHWDKALRKNGQLAVDVILAIQAWRISEENVPDPRQNASEAEKEKIKVVEKLESQQEGKARHFDGAEEAPKENEVKKADGEEKEEERAKINGVKSLTNGFHHDDKK